MATKKQIIETDVIKVTSRVKRYGDQVVILEHYCRQRGTKIHPGDMLAWAKIIQYFLCKRQSKISKIKIKQNFCFCYPQLN